MFDTILPYLLAGVSVGGQYALIAVGYTMVYGILRLINFAHGDIFTAAGFFMVYLTATLPLSISVPLVILLTVALGFLYYALMARVGAVAFLLAVIALFAVLALVLVRWLKTSGAKIYQHL